MRRAVIIFVILVCGILITQDSPAQLTTTFVGPGGNGSAGPPPTCNNGSLKFQQPCNAVFAH